MISAYRVDLCIKFFGKRYFLPGNEYYQYEVEAKVLEDYLKKRLSHFPSNDIYIYPFITPVDPEHGDL